MQGMAGPGASINVYSRRLQRKIDLYISSNVSIVFRLIIVGSMELLASPSPSPGVLGAQYFQNPWPLHPP